MTHEQFLEQKPKLEEVLYNAIFKTLSAMSIEDIKKLDWFSYDKPMPTIVEDDEVYDAVDNSK